MRLNELRRGAFVIGVIALLVLPTATVSCGGSDVSESVTGEIIDVVPGSIDTVGSLTIRDDSGQLWTFGPARIPHFTPSHLIEHQANGDRIMVLFREEPDGSRTVVEIEDAAP